MNMPWFLLDLPTMDEITAAIGDWLALMFFWLIKIVFNIMDVFMDIIFQLAGLKDLGGTGSNILSSFFSNDSGSSNNSISTLYFYICLACVVLMIFLAVISIIKQDFFSEEPAKSHAPIFKRMVTGLLYFIAIPPIFIFAVEIVAGLMSALMQIDSFSAVSSLSQTIFELSLTEPEWMKVEGVQLDPIPHWSVVEAKDFVALTKTYDFNWLIFIGIIGMSFYSLFMIAFGLVKRVFNLVLLYILGPIAISQSVLDGGNKMKNWKDNVIKEFISIFGTVIGLVIFFMFVTEVVSNLELFSIEGKTGFGRTAALLGNTVVKAMFILVGFSVIKSGGSGYIANAIGGNLSVDDGKNAFSGMKDSAKFAAAPFKAPGNAARSITKAVGNAGKKVVGTAHKIGKAANYLSHPQELRRWAQKHGPTLDGFRTEEQLERVKKQRETVAAAEKAARESPNDAGLQRVVNGNTMNQYTDQVLNTGHNGNPSWTAIADGNRTSAQTVTGLSNTSTNNGVTVSHTTNPNVTLPQISADYNSNDYVDAKRNVKVAIEEETELMNRDVGQAQAELQRLVSASSSYQAELQRLVSSGTATPAQIASAQAAVTQNQADIARQQEVVHQTQVLHQTRITELTTAQENIVKTENQHKAIHEVRQAQNTANTAGNGLNGTARQAAEINARTKLGEKMKEHENTFK